MSYEKLVDEVANLVKLQDKYILLLTDELEEVVPFAKNCGWRSERYDRGRELRRKMAVSKDEICKHDDSTEPP